MRRHVHLLTLAAFLASLAGCNTQGGYTREHASAARTRLDQLKSASEWEMGMQAFLAGDLEKALKRADTAIALNESVAKSHVLRARILLEMGNVGGSLESLARATAIDPEHTDAHYYCGIANERLAQREKALECYLRAAELDHTNAQYGVAAAEMYMDLGRLDEAEAFLLAQGEIFVHHAGVKQTMGHLAMLRSDHEHAVECFSEARLLAPDDRGILEDLTKSQFAARQFSRAESNLVALLSTPEGEARRDLQLMRARCLMELKRPVDAREILVSLTTGPEGASDVEAWIQLGNVSYTLRDLARVRAASARLVAIAPLRPDGHVLRSLMLRKQKNLEGALAAIDEAIALGEPATSSLLLRGMILDDLGRLSEARDAFSLVAQRDPENASARTLLATVESRMDDSALAEVPTNSGD